MDGFAWIVVIGIAIWLLTNSGSSSTRTSSRPTNTSPMRSVVKPSNQSSHRSAVQFPRGSNVIRDGFQPDDRCSCGGTWVKRENRETGGRFFSCSRYPTCTNSREQVLKARLGAKYSEIYCSRGHHMPSTGTIFDDKRGKMLCKKCVDKGYLVLRPRATSSRNEDRNDVGKPTVLRGVNGSGASSKVEKCRNGHPRTQENTYIRPDGSRECRICKRNTRRQ